MPQRRRRVESRDFAITEIDFSNEMSDPDDRFDHAQHFWASTVESRSCSARRRGVVSKRAMNQLLRSLEKLGYVVGSDGLDGGPRDLCASPGVDMSSTRKFSVPARRIKNSDHKMPSLVRATALAAVTTALSDASSAAACRHFSIWHFPFPQPCPPIGQFIVEPSPPIPAPASPPTPDEERRRQQGIEKLKERLNSQKQQ